MKPQETLPAEQLYYTSSQRGARNSLAYQVIAATPALAESDYIHLERHMAYIAPMGFPAAPDSAAIQRFPVAFRAVPLEDGDRLLLRSGYVGREYKLGERSERWGNFFVHVVVVSADTPAFAPFELISQLDWKTGLSSLELTALCENETLPIPALNRQPRAVLAPHKNARALATLCLARWLGSGNRILVDLVEHEAVFDCMQAAQNILPPEISLALSWSSYETDNTRGYDVFAVAPNKITFSTDDFATLSSGQAIGLAAEIVAEAHAPTTKEPFWQVIAELGGLASAAALKEAWHVYGVAHLHKSTRFAESQRAIAHIIKLAPNAVLKKLMRQIYTQAQNCPDVKAKPLLQTATRAAQWAKDPDFVNTDHLVTHYFDKIVAACLSGEVPIVDGTTQLRDVATINPQVAARICDLYFEFLRAPPDSPEISVTLRLKVATMVGGRDPRLKRLRAKLVRAALALATPKNGAKPAIAELKKLVQGGVTLQEIMAGTDEAILKDDLLDGIVKIFLPRQPKQLPAFVDQSHRIDRNGQLTNAVLFHLADQNIMPGEIIGKSALAISKAAPTLYTAKHVKALISRLIDSDTPEHGVMLYELYTDEVAGFLAQNGGLLLKNLEAKIDAAIVIAGKNQKAMAQGVFDAFSDGTLSPLCPNACLVCLATAPDSVKLPRQGAQLKINKTLAAADPDLAKELFEPVVQAHIAPLNFPEQIRELQKWRETKPRIGAAAFVGPQLQGTCQEMFAALPDTNRALKSVLKWLDESGSGPLREAVEAALLNSAKRASRQNFERFRTLVLPYDKKSRVSGLLKAAQTSRDARPSQKLKTMFARAKSGVGSLFSRKGA